jgi:hypothetical protein
MFAIELSLIDPLETSSNLNSLDLYKHEETYSMTCRSNNQILNRNNFKNNNVRDTIVIKPEINRKRKFSQFRKMNSKNNEKELIDNQIIIAQTKRFKILSIEDN